MLGGLTGVRAGDLSPFPFDVISIPLMPSAKLSSLPSSLTTKGCFLRRPVPNTVVGIPLSRLFELLTPPGGLGSGLLPEELKPIRSSDLMDDKVSDRSIVACLGE